MRFSVLGSGSSGNATFVSGGSTRILVDAGFSARELGKRLASVGVAPKDLAAILITHEHGDHTRGVGVFARTHGTRLLMTAGTRDACKKLLKGNEVVETYRPGYPLSVDDLLIEPCTTLHDASEPVAIAIGDRSTGLRLGIATDLGKPTVQVKHALRDCDGLIIESNHDEEMLWSAGYPKSVKARIASNYGHLSNQAAVGFVLELLSPRLSAVVLAHLSQESNTPRLAITAMELSLRKRGFRGLVTVAKPDGPMPVVDLAELRRRSGPAQLSLSLADPQ